MKDVYEKLLEQLSSMTPEQKVKEWEELKVFNSVGPEMVNCLSGVDDVLSLNAPEVSVVDVETKPYVNTYFCFAA